MSRISQIYPLYVFRGQANAAIPRQVAKDGFSNTSINGGIGADWTSLLRFVGVYTAGNMAKTGQEQGSNRVMEVRRIAFIYSEGIGLQAVEFWKKEYQAVCANIGLLINETEIKLRSAGRGTQRDWDRTLAEIGPNEFDFVFAMIDRQDEYLYYTIKTKLLVDKKMSNQVRTNQCLWHFLSVSNAEGSPFSGDRQQERCWQRSAGAEQVHPDQGGNPDGGQAGQGALGH